MHIVIDENLINETLVDETLHYISASILGRTSGVIGPRYILILVIRADRKRTSLRVYNYNSAATVC